MSVDLIAMNLEDALEALIDYRGKTPKKTSSGVPLVTAKIVKAGKILPTEEFIATENFDSWMVRGLPKIGDVVLTTEAPLGEVAQIKNLPVALAQRIVTLRGKEGLLSNDYLKYLLLSPQMQDKLHGRSSGSTVVGIKQSELRKIEIQLPTIEYQREVAAILKALDNQIDNLESQNTTLESIAQTLFKSWFVNFDPVHAKAAGLEPEGMSPELAALFPSEFEESELGLIPKGWSVKSFGQCLDLTLGGDWGKECEDEKHSKKMLIIRGTDIPGIRSSKTTNIPIRYLSENKAQKRTLKGGDIVIEVSGGSKEQSTGRAVRISNRLINDSELSFAPTSFCRLFRPLEAFSEFLTCRIYCHYDEGVFWKYQVQSTGIANLQTTFFLENDKFACPPEELLLKFSELVKPMLDSTFSPEIATLERIRDELLPRLISGKLRIEEAEEAVSEVLGTQSESEEEAA